MSNEQNDNQAKNKTWKVLTCQVDDFCVIETTTTTTSSLIAPRYFHERFN